MKGRLRGDRGATAVETAIVLPLLLLLIGGILVFGLRMTYGALAGHTAEVGLTKATIRTSGGYPTQTQVDTSLRELGIATFLGEPSEPVTVDVVPAPGRPAGDRPRQGDRVTVTVEYDVPVVRAAAGLFPFLSALEGLASIRRTVEGRLE